MCRVAWGEKFNYLCTDMTKNKNEGKHRIFIEKKTRIFNVFVKQKHFIFLNVVCN